MNKFAVSKLACAVAMVGISASAGATTTDLGVLSIGATAFNGTVLSGPPPKEFADFFTFVLPANGGSAYSVLNFEVPDLFLNLTFASLALVTMGPNNAPGGGDDVIVDAAAGPGKTLSVSMDGIGASQGMYLFVSGFTTGAAGGLYSGAISVSPVPEPEAWAMMLVGAGLVGFRLRNRSKKAAANRFA